MTASAIRGLDDLPWSPDTKGSISRGVIKLSKDTFNALSQSAPNLNYDEDDDDDEVNCFGAAGITNVADRPATNTVIRKKKSQKKKSNKPRNEKRGPSKLSALHMSAPNLNFDEDELDCMFDEPDFTESPANSTVTKMKKCPPSAKVRTNGRKERDRKEIDMYGALSMSAPNLNFDPDDDDEVDDFDFSGGSGSDLLASPTRRSTMRIKKKSPMSVKVKASELKNMSGQEKEIKDLFSQWKQKNTSVGTSSGSHADEKQAMTALSPTKSPLKLSVVKKVRSQSQNNPKDDGSYFVPNPHRDFDFEEGEEDTTTICASLQPPISPLASPSRGSGPGGSPRRKKVAVKLKASDLNLSESKKKEIEALFMKWKGDVIDTNSQVTVIFSSPNDQRWKTDEELSAAAKAASRRDRAAKAVCRQRSSSLDPDTRKYEDRSKRRGAPRAVRRQRSSSVDPDLREFDRDRKSSNSVDHYIGQDKIANNDTPSNNGSVDRCSNDQDTTSVSEDASFAEESLYRGRSREPHRGSRRPTKGDARRSLSRARSGSSRSPSRRRDSSRSRGGKRSKSQGNIIRRRHSVDETDLDQRALKQAISSCSDEDDECVPPTPRRSKSDEFPAARRRSSSSLRLQRRPTNQPGRSQATSGHNND